MAVFGYSHVSAEHVMHPVSRMLAAGVDYLLRRRSGRVRLSSITPAKCMRTSRTMGSKAPCRVTPCWGFPIFRGCRGRGSRAASSQPVQRRFTSPA
jgi:hypothetical protein